MTLRATAGIVAAAVWAAAATPVQAQGGPVVPARAAAAASAFQDSDVAWILPLLDAAAADARRDARQLQAATDALSAQLSDEAVAARVAAIRDGGTHALDDLRARSAEAAVPAAARYDRVCSAALTASVGGLSTTAAYAVNDVNAARDLYRRLGWTVLGDQASGFVLGSPDGAVRGSLASPLADAGRIAAEVERRGLAGYDHARACAGIPAGAALLLTADVHSAAPASGDGALAAALAAAGLTAAQWEAVLAALWQADLDRLMPGTPSPEPATPAEAARRRANVEWLVRNLARVEPALQRSSTGG